MSAKPRPQRDRDSQPWWEALARHELSLQRCDACGAWRWPPRALCNRCGSFEASWRATGGRGTVASWIVSHHPFSNAFSTPYAVVTIRLDEQSDLLLPGAFSAPPDRLRVGLAVRVDFEDLSADASDAEAAALLTWHPVEDG